MLRYAATVLPDRNSQTWKCKRTVNRVVLQAAKQVLGRSALALAFGSSVNGCGESTSDLDLVLYLPPAKTKLPVRTVLRRVLGRCQNAGLVFDESRLTAKVPIFSVRDRRNLCSCDVSYDNYLPLYNSRLLRAYVDLEPRLAVLAVVVKRFAKLMGVGSTLDGYISSYSWTLMVVYYLQVCQGMPSLHTAGVARKSQGSENGFALDFAIDLLSWQDSPSVGLADLLRGFFDFYANSFNWSSEVVSVWRGSRGTTQGLHPGFRTNIGAFHIQDPIELQRNLNFALTENHIQRINDMVVQADKALRAGAGLPDCMMDEAVPELPGAWLRDPDLMLRKRLRDFFEPFSRLNELPEPRPKERQSGKMLSRARSFGCAQCPRGFATKEALEEHQRATGHVGIVRYEPG